MPLKISVGLSKKIGLPDYGSLGASCNVEYEADGTQLTHDLEAFHRQVQSAFVACREAVQEELCRNQNSEPASQQQTNGNGTSGKTQRSNGRKATTSQVRALGSIANRLQLDMAKWLQQKYGLNLASELSIKDASSAIDELNATPANNNGANH